MHGHRKLLQDLRNLAADLSHLLHGHAGRWALGLALLALALLWLKSRGRGD